MKNKLIKIIGLIVILISLDGVITQIQRFSNFIFGPRPSFISLSFFIVFGISGLGLIFMKNWGRILYVISAVWGSVGVIIDMQESIRTVTPGWEVYAKIYCFDVGIIIIFILTSLYLFNKNIINKFTK